MWGGTKKKRITYLANFCNFAPIDNPLRIHSYHTDKTHSSVECGAFCEELLPIPFRCPSRTKVRLLSESSFFWNSTICPTLVGRPTDFIRLVRLSGPTANMKSDTSPKKSFNFGENSKKVVIKSNISRTRTKCRTVGQKSDTVRVGRSESDCPTFVRLGHQP